MHRFLSNCLKALHFISKTPLIILLLISCCQTGLITHNDILIASPDSTSIAQEKY